MGTTPGLCPFQGEEDTGTDRSSGGSTGAQTQPRCSRSYAAWLCCKPRRCPSCSLALV